PARPARAWAGGRRGGAPLLPPPLIPRAPGGHRGAAASACGPTYGVRGSLPPVAGTAATGFFLAGIGGSHQPSRAGGPLTRVQASTPRTTRPVDHDLVRLPPLL